MSNNTNKCKRCKYFYVFYTRGIKRYSATEYGWCRKNVRIAEQNEKCEQYLYKGKQQTSKRFTRLILSDMLTDLSEIRSVLQGEKDENE